MHKRAIHAPAQYNDYMPPETIVDQLVAVDNDEIGTPIAVTPDSLLPAFADFIIDNTVICSITDDAAVDLSSVKEARYLKYQNE